MANTSSPFALMAAPLAGTKRSRDDAGGQDEAVARGFGFEKKARPTSGDSTSWPRDSAISTPRSQPQSKYDSDDQSSMMSEPGSPQDIDMSSSDDGDHDQLLNTRSSEVSGRAWHAHQTQQQRIPTPTLTHQHHHSPPSPRPGVRPIQLRTAGFPSSPSHHIRGRHPQENLSSSFSEHLEVPSPIDEDEVPTPPSAAEAAGSQLSMLSVNDMDVEPAGPPPAVPRINVDVDVNDETAVESPTVDMLEDSSAAAARAAGLMARKPRQRSGAVSSGGHSAASPVRGGECWPGMGMGGALGGGLGGGGGVKKGFSMGFRADCEKCRLRVPGHMNHFVAS